MPIIYFSGVFLQRETLLKQLETNSREIQSTLTELDVHEDSEEQNYEMWAIDQIIWPRVKLPIYTYYSFILYRILILFWCVIFYRFLETVTCKRREQQEKLSQKAVKDAKKKQDLDKTAAELKAQQEALKNGTAPPPVTMPVSHAGSGDIKHGNALRH